MKLPATDQKLRGGYYTPKAVASFLASWAVRTAKDTVLEPSCGDGEIVEALVGALRARRARPAHIASQLRAVEFDAAEAQKTKDRLDRLGVPAPGSVFNGDFFAHCRAHGSARYDAVVGNPPFIRYQNFPNEQREIAFDLMRSVGMHPNGLTNAWVPFVCLATTLLKDDGRLAMVIPSELLQVSYSAELRRFLSDSFQRITLFTFKRLLFAEAQQEVVLFCGERGGGTRTGIEVVEMTDASDLASYDPKATSSAARKPMDHSTEKWTQYFLSRREITLLRAMRANDALTRLGEIASVDVGVVTGLNEFFVLTEADRAKRRLATHTVPVVTRSAQLEGLVFGANNLRAHAEDVRAHMLNLPSCTFDRLPAAAQAYIREGEERGCNLGFKCRTRKPWWVVPGPWVPDAFMLRQVHRHPKVAVNRTNATCTDTVHRVRLLNGVSAQTLSAGFLNALSFAFSEVLGRSYGGGVLELEPTEAEKIPVPLRGAEKLDFDALNTLVANNRLDDALEETDRVLLADGLGLSARDIAALRGIWTKLSERRRTRNASSRAVSGLRGKNSQRVAPV